MIRKYFDATPGESSGGGITVGATRSVADFLNQPAQETTETQTQTETKVENNSVENTGANVPQETSSNEPGAPEKKDASEAPVTQTETKVETPVQATPAQPATPTAVDLKEVLKGKGTREVIEAAGYDAFFADLLEHHANGGDVMEFISVKTKDWNKVSDEEIMRDSLRKTYGDLSDEDFNALYDAEVVSKYALSEGDDFTDSEKRVGKIRLKAEADRLRKERIAEQGNFKLPDASKPVDRAQVIQELEQEQSAQYAEYTNQVNGNEVTQRLRNDKRIVIGEGNEAYNFAVDSDKVIGAILDTNKLFEPCLVKDAEGKVTGYNFNKAYKLAAFANDMEAYDKALINHGKSLATNDQIEEAVNPARKDNTPGQPTNKSLAETFATEGRNTTVAAIMGR